MINKQPTETIAVIKTFLILVVISLTFEAFSYKAVLPFENNLIMSLATPNYIDSLKEWEGSVIEQMPQYPGGEKELMRFIQANIKYPEAAKSVSAHGTVIVTIVIDKEGKVNNAKVIRSIHPALDAEALRVISLLSDWIPGKQGGKPVAVSYTIPVRFNLQANDEKMPQFPGGEKAFLKYIMEHLKYPVEAMKDSAQGKVFVTFTVKKDGKMEDVKVSRSVHPVLDAEAIRLVSSSPEWLPGKEGVNEVSYEIPIDFNMQTAIGNSSIQPNEEPKVVEEMPQFPGGEKALMKFIVRNLNYPTAAAENKIKGTVMVNFTVEIDGKISNPRAVWTPNSTIDPDLVAETFRIIKLMPAWIPGKQGGKAVKVSYTIPFKFLMD
jgi:TonB family protein